MPVGGGCQVVSILAFYSDDPSLNPAEACSFFCKIGALRERNITERVRSSPIKKSDSKIVPENDT